MKKNTKIWLITATSLVLLGCILFAGVMTTLKWDFMELATANYETNTYEISETFDSISMNTDTADITFTLSDDGKCTVECYEEENEKHSVTAEDGTLAIQLIDERTVYDFIGYIGLNFDTPKITVCLPKTEFESLAVNGSTGDVAISNEFTFGSVDLSLSTGDVVCNAKVSNTMKVQTSTGDICVENTSAGNVDLSVSTGTVIVSDVTSQDDININVTTGKSSVKNIICNSLISGGNTSDLYLNNVIATEKFTIKRSTGDVECICCDANEIYVETDTGDVTGSLLTDKFFVTNTDTGSVEVPKSVTGGKCEVSTNTGDIIIDVIK